MAIGRTASKPDNSRIEQATTAQPALIDQDNYVPITKKNIYEFMNNAYFGTGGFRDGSYLVPHKREMFYDERRNLCFYKNYIAPIVGAMIDPIFHDPIEREYPTGDSSLVSVFVENADNAETSLHGYMYTATMYAVLHGITFIVMDNFPDQPQAKTEAAGSRILPYIYLKKASELIEVKADAFGKLQEIIFSDESEKIVNQAGQTLEEARYVKWDPLNWYKLKKDATGNGWIVLETKVHGLDHIPITPFIYGEKTSQNNLRIEPPLYDLAKVNFTIYNKDSEVRDQERAQGFSIFYLQTDKSGSITIGTKNALLLPMETTIPPGFASPPPAILDMLRKGNDELREDLFRIAGQRGIVGVQSQKSGVAMQWDFRAEEFVLQGLSQLCRSVEIKILKMFGEYINEDFDYDAKYPDDFAPRDEIGELDQIERALDMGMPIKASTILKIKAFMAVVKNGNADEIKEAVNEFEAFAEEEIKRKDAAAALANTNIEDEDKDDNADDQE